MATVLVSEFDFASGARLAPVTVTSGRVLCACRTMPCLRALTAATAVAASTSLRRLAGDEGALGTAARCADEPGFWDPHPGVYQHSAGLRLLREARWAAECAADHAPAPQSTRNAASERLGSAANAAAPPPPGYTCSQHVGYTRLH